jgi:hypothetical protein
MRTASSFSHGVDVLLSGLSPFSALPTVFAVVGEHRADPDRLLLLGDDGRYYAYQTDDGVPIAVELTADWAVDAAEG